MHLADFIRQNSAKIVKDWESFARTYRGDIGRTVLCDNSPCPGFEGRWNIPQAAQRRKDKRLFQPELAVAHMRDVDGVKEKTRRMLAITSINCPLVVLRFRAGAPMVDAPPWTTNSMFGRRNFGKPFRLVNGPKI